MGCRETDGAKRSPKAVGAEGRRLHQPEVQMSSMEALVVDPKRIALIAADLVTHLTPSPPTQSGCARRNAVGVSPVR